MKQNFLFLSLLSLLLSAACKKGSCIEGTVTDIKMNKPISGAQITLQYQVSESGSSVSHSEVVVSDDSGQFSFSAEEKSSEDISVAAAFKGGYSRVYEEKWDNKGKGCSDAQIKMTPLDGVLKLTIQNETGLHDTMLVEIFNKCEYQFQKNWVVRSTQPRYLMLPKGGTHVQIFPTCVGDSSAVQWRLTKSGPWLHTDSVLVKTADTTFFKIVY